MWRMRSFNKFGATIRTPLSLVRTRILFSWISNVNTLCIKIEAYFCAELVVYPPMQNFVYTYRLECRRWGWWLSTNAYTLSTSAYYTSIKSVSSLVLLSSTSTLTTSRSNTGTSSFSWWGTGSIIELNLESASACVLVQTFLYLTSK